MFTWEAKEERQATEKYDVKSSRVGKKSGNMFYENDWKKALSNENAFSLFPYMIWRKVLIWERIKKTVSESENEL